jgi:hypothetical protein
VPWVFIEKTSPGQPDPEVDWSRPGINGVLYPGQKLVFPSTQGIPDALMQMLTLIEGKAQEMTVPKVLFGQSPGASTSFSALNLLTQGGRLPLVPIQSAVETALSKAFRLILLWIAEKGQEITVQAGGLVADIDPQSIDQRTVWVEVQLEPRLPQDLMSLVNASQLAHGSGFISRRTAREWLHVADDTGEQEQIYMEQFMDAHAQQYQEAAAEAAGLETVPPQAEPELPGMEAGQGMGFNPAAGGLPQVAAGLLPDVVPGMPGGGGGETP